MYYYEFKADTPYCGTDSTYYEKHEQPLTQKEIDERCREYCDENASSYEYLVEDEYDNEEYEDEGEHQENVEMSLLWYREGCSCECREITEEEYLENT